MNTFVDRKRAASGEREDEAEMPLASPQSLIEALRGTRTKQRSSEQDKAPVEPLVRSASTPSIFDAGIGPLRNVMENHPSVWTVGMSYHIQDDREITVQFGKGASGSVHGLEVGRIDGTHLVFEPVNDRYDCGAQSMEKLHPMVYRFQVNRSDLIDHFDEPFGTMVLEAGFYSRPIGAQPSRYLGKVKLFFPRPHEGLVFYLDLSKLR